MEDKNAMSNLQIITSIKNNSWVLEFELAIDATTPRDIFLFENKGETLGEYQGVCTIEDYRRFQTFTEGISIPVFANKFLKYYKGLMIFSLDNDPDPIRKKIVADVKSFNLAYTTGNTSTSVYVV